MSKPFVIAITGPSGSGKSTVAAKLAKEIEQCVNIDADYVKHFIANGFIYDDTSAGVKQWELLGENVGILARNFLQQGYSVIINGCINEPAWKRLRKHVELTYGILLLPDLLKVKERDAGRKPDDRMGEEAVERHHGYFSEADYFKEFVTIDSTEHTIEETVALIQSKI